MSLKVMYSKKTDDWKTPSELMQILLNNGWIDCFKYQAQYNELERIYYNNFLYINPPYSKMKEVTKWIIEQYKNNNEIILLIPARTDTKYFHELLHLKPVIYFIKGRLHYNESNAAPFPSIMMHFNKYSKPIYKFVTFEELKERITQLCRKIIY